jgi:hypothetical protein
MLPVACGISPKAPPFIQMVQSKQAVNATPSEKGVGGAKKKAEAEKMRAAAWVSDLKRRTGAKTYADLTRALTPTNPTFDPTWGRYVSGQATPQEGTISTVERHWIGKGSSRVLEVGPEEDGANVPLWRLFGDRDDFARLLADALDDIGICRAPNADLDAVLELFVEPTARAAGFPPVDLGYREDNEVTRSAANGYFKPSLRLLALAFNGWRLAMVCGGDAEAFEYVVRCLVQGVCRPILTFLGIYDSFCKLTMWITVRHNLESGDLVAAQRAASELDRQATS